VNKRLFGLLLGLAVSGLFIWLTLRRVDLGEVARHAGEASLAILALTQVTKLTSVLFMTARSRVVYGGLGDYTFGGLFRSILVALSGNTVLPFRIGELLRVGYLSRTGGAAPATCLTGLALERLLDASCLVILFFAVAPFTVLGAEVETSLFALAGALIVTLGSAIAVSRQPEPFLALMDTLLSPLPEALTGKLRGPLARLVRGLSALSSPASVIKVLLFSMGSWLCGAGSILVWLYAFDLALPWYAPFVVLFSISLGSFLPSSPSAIGTYHYFAVTALVLMGVDQDRATSVAVLGHVMAFVPFTILSLPILLPDLARLWRERQEAA